MDLPTEEREITLQKTERVYVRISLGIIIGLVVLVAVCWGGRHAYLRWQERNLMHQAHVAFDKTDFRWAVIAAQRAYSLDDTSVDACRTLADIAEKQNSDQAIEWRRRALALDPKSFGDRLSLANTALRFSQPAIAVEALAHVPPGQQQDAGYQAAAARIALTKSDLTAAGQHLRQAVALAPNDPAHALELAEFQLRSENRAERDAGHTTAMQLKANPKVRLDALHILVSAALARRDGAEGVSLAKELDALPDTTPADRLLALGILHQTNDPAFAAALTKFEAESAKSSEQAVRLMSWMNSNGLALLALDWSKQLPPEMLGSIAMRFALADSYVQLRDWPALTTLLRRGSWDRAEPLRIALEAKVAYETNDHDGYEKSWAAAVAKASDDSDRLDSLQKLAFQWHWPEKGVAILWLLAENPAQQQAALQSLYNYYAAARDTTGLYRTLTRLVAVMPHDPMVRNNFAQISLLLRAESLHALALAREVHQEQPGNAAFASTYAFALYENNDVAGALKVMNSLTPPQLQDPAVAAYYGVILAEAGRNDEAVKFLEAANGAHLLPEEEKLIARARRIISRPKDGGGT
ncbi:MAG: hypothetical protein H0X40_14100 [Chthoniobacterales bacterium]|nr:hypothetical protein [Chthoniobacterales bacterium]